MSSDSYKARDGRSSGVYTVRDPLAGSNADTAGGVYTVRDPAGQNRQPARSIHSPSHRLPRTEVGRRCRLEGPCSLLNIHHHQRPASRLRARRCSRRWRPQMIIPGHAYPLHFQRSTPGVQASSQAVEFEMIGRSAGGRTASSRLWAWRATRYTSSPFEGNRWGDSENHVHPGSYGMSMKVWFSQSDAPLMYDDMSEIERNRCYHSVTVWVSGWSGNCLNCYLAMLRARNTGLRQDAMPLWAWYADKPVCNRKPTAMLAWHASVTVTKYRSIISIV